jgi:uncharacterized protein (UPF0332 family)
MNKSDKNQLIKYRLEQARDTIEIVELLIENDKLAAAVNRIYYGIFYSLLALGLKYDFETSKHLQLIGWFNKEFIRSNRIEVEYGKVLRKAYENRTSGDYDAFYEFEKEDVSKLFEEMKGFIKRIERFVE